MDIGERVAQAVYQAIDEVNATLDAESRVAKASDTVLVGESGALDSIGFVNLVVALEQAVEQHLGCAISVMDFVEESDLREFTVAKLLNRLTEALEPARQEVPGP